MYAIGLTKGLVVGAAGGALVLAGFAGGGPSTSSAADLVASAPQAAVEDAAPNPDLPVNIYKVIGGTATGSLVAGTGKVSGSWIQAPDGELVNTDDHGAHTLAVTQVRFTDNANTHTLRLTLAGVAKGTLTGTVLTHRKTLYNGTLRTRQGGTVTFKDLKLKSEFRGYDLVSGVLTVHPAAFPIGIAMTVDSGCIHRGKGRVVGIASIATVHANLSAKTGAIKPDNVVVDIDVVTPLAMHLPVDLDGANHVYTDTGTTDGGTKYEVADLTLAKRTEVGPCSPFPTP